MEVNVSGRFKVLDQPMASPSKCAFCGLGHNQDGTVQFIDTTLDLDFFGVVYICSVCLTEISAALGYLHPDAWEKVVDDSTSTLIENERLMAENDALRDMVANLVTHRCYRNSSAPPVSETSSGVKLDEVSNGAPKGIKPSESKSDPSSSQSGLSNVRRVTESKPVKRLSEPSKPNDDPLAEFDL